LRSTHGITGSVNLNGNNNSLDIQCCIVGPHNSVVGNYNGGFAPGDFVLTNSKASFLDDGPTSKLMSPTASIATVHLSVTLSAPESTASGDSAAIIPISPKS
jgi:hypothetical protein